MNSNFRVRFVWYVIGAPVAGLLLPASAALLVDLRHLRPQLLSSEFDKSR